MNYFLAKTEPSTYSIEDLQKDQETEWSGVRSAQALIFIRQMKPGDRIFIYHSGGESTIRGLAEIISEPRPDKKDPKSWVVDVKFLKMLKPVTLKEIKESQKFKDFRLVYQSRLSTMPVPENFVKWLSEEKGVEL